MICPFNIVFDNYNFDHYSKFFIRIPIYLKHKSMANQFILTTWWALMSNKKIFRWVKKVMIIFMVYCFSFLFKINKLVYCEFLAIFFLQFLTRGGYQSFHIAPLSTKNLTIQNLWHRPFFKDKHSIADWRIRGDA